MYATFHIRNHVRDRWFDPREGLWCVFIVKRRPSTQLFDLHGCVAWKCSYRSTCLHTTCHTISYVVLDRHVSTQCVYYETYSCTCSHTKRRLSVHFLTYEVMPMRNFKHIIPCLSHNFLQVQSKQSTTSQLFNLQTLLTIQLLTYKDVSVRKLSHRRTWLCATYHIISNVLSRQPCFHALCGLRVAFMRVFAH